MAHPHGAHARRTLIKDETGKCRPTSYDLPPKDNVYGIKMTGLGEGAASVMGNLEVHTASKPAVSDQDLVRCNRMAVKNKLITAKDQYNFQLSHQDVKKIHSRHSMFEKPEIPEHAKSRPFGIASYPRPADDTSIIFKPPDGSISKVINNEFAKKPTGPETYPDISGRVHPGKMPAPKDTNSNRLKTKANTEQPAPKEKFIMKRFQNIPAKTTNK